MTCAQCHITLRAPTESKFCDVCHSMLASLYQSDSMATHFIEATIEERRQLQQWAAEKQALLGDKDERT